MLCRSHKTASVSRPLASLRFVYVPWCPLLFIWLKFVFSDFNISRFVAIFLYITFFLLLTIKKHYCFPTTKSVDISTEIYLSTPPPQHPDHDPLLFNIKLQWAYQDNAGQNFLKILCCRFRAIFICPNRLMCTDCVSMPT